MAKKVNGMRPPPRGGGILLSVYETAPCSAAGKKTTIYDKSYYILYWYIFSSFFFTQTHQISETHPSAYNSIYIYTTFGGVVVDSNIHEKSNIVLLAVVPHDVFVCVCVCSFPLFVRLVLLRSAHRPIDRTTLTD